MEPVKYETLPAFKVMGMKYRGNNANQEIAQMWGALNPRYNEIPVVKDSCAYGLCYTIENSEDGSFEYVAGFEVTRADDLPEGMVVRTAVLQRRLGITTVFVTHEHRDHFDSTIFGWPGTIPKLTYLFGFQPESLDVNMRQGFTNQPYEYVGPAMTKTLDGMKVLAVRSNDAGAGYVVKVDGLTIYHAGDLAGWRPNERDGFISQIDSIDAIFDSVDIALVNVTGCHHQDTLALVEGTEYTIAKLQPKLIIPTHGFMREKYYRQFMNKFAGTYPDLLSFCPVWRGDAIKFSGGGKPARTELL